MFYSNDRNQIRQFYFEVWQKYQSQQTLSSLETQILRVILLHPEYHTMLNAKDSGKDFSQEMSQHNPFMHMGLHLAIGDQVHLNQPQGIRELFAKQLAKGLDEHTVEHQFMDVLAEHMWQATTNSQAVDMVAYCASLKQDLRKTR